MDEPLADAIQVRIRSAKTRDCADLARVQVSAWQDAYVGLLADQALIEMNDVRIAARWARLLSGLGTREVVYVADWDGRVVGFCHGGVHRGPGASQGLGTARGSEIFTFYVDPGFQGLGIGTSLLFCMIERLQALGFETLMLLALKGNHIGHRFYQRFGGIPGAAMACVVMGTQVAEIPYRWDSLGDLLDRLELAMTRDHA